MKSNIIFKLNTQLRITFSVLKNSPSKFRDKQTKIEISIGSLWEVQTKNAKKTIFTINLSQPSVFE